MFWNVFLRCSPFSNTLLLNSFMIMSPLDSFVSLGSLQHYCWLHRNFPRRNKVPGPGKHFLIEIPLRKWCHSHHSHMRHSVTSNILHYYNSVSQCTLTSVQLILQSIQSFVTPPPWGLSDCQAVITFLHLHSLRLNSPVIGIINTGPGNWTCVYNLGTGDPHIGGYKKYSNALNIPWNLISICHVSLINDLDI